MKKIRTFIIGLMFISNFIYADTILVQNDVSNRSSSVRNIVDKVGTLEVKDVSLVDEFKQMFTEGKTSGQIRMQSVGYKQKAVANSDTYATAIGGILRYELAQLNGFNAGVAFYTAHDIGFATGTDTKHNNELASSAGDYSELGEAYLNYKYNDFNIRLGRQPLDTPLADSDDIRIIQNSFEAYTASYKYNNIELMFANIQSWQGYDAGLDDGWSKTGKDGTNVVGLSYDDLFELQVWYYNITKELNALYLEAGVEYNFSEDIILHTMMQYLNETELDNSGYGANIYGASFEFTAYGFGVNLAFDKSQRQALKQSFSGTGGGAMFTSMDTSIIDDIAVDRDVLAIVGGLVYSVDAMNLIYAYGDFNGGRDSIGIKEHTVEQDLGIEYNVNDAFLASFIYVMKEDKEQDQKTDNDWDRYQFMLNYNF